MPFLGTTPTQGFVGANPKQSFTANGSTTVFTLTNPVASANDLEVFVGNVRQEPTAAYSAAGTTLTMTEAPDTGLNFYVINKSQAQVTTTPPVNSISTDKILNDAVTGAKIENNPTIAGNLGVAGDLTVDTSSLKVNASNNYIGIGTASPQKKIHILDTTSDGNMIFDRNGTSTDHQIIFAHNYQSGGQSGGNYYGIGVDGSENKLVFAYDANSQASLSSDAKMTLNSSGVLSVPSGVELGSGVDATVANTLDDYEEGTFTATLVATGSTFQYTYRTGAYTKIGNTVYFNLYIQLDGGGNSFVGNAVTISGLPFTSNSGANNNFRYYVHGRYLNVDGSNYYYVTANLSNGSAGFSLNQAGDNVPNKALPATYLSSSSGQLFINGHYITN